MAVIIKKLVIKNQILDKNDNNDKMLLKSLAEQVKDLSLQVKNLKGQVEGIRREHER